MTGRGAASPLGGWEREASVAPTAGTSRAGTSILDGTASSRSQRASSPSSSSGPDDPGVLPTARHTSCPRCGRSPGLLDDWGWDLARRRRDLPCPVPASRGSNTTWDAVPLRLAPAPVRARSSRTTTARAAYPVAIFELDARRTRVRDPDPGGADVHLAERPRPGTGQRSVVAVIATRSIRRDGASGIVMLGPDSATNASLERLALRSLAPDADGVSDQRFAKSSTSTTASDALGRFRPRRAARWRPGRAVGIRVVARHGEPARPGDRRGRWPPPIELAPGRVAATFQFVLAWDLPTRRVRCAGRRWYRRYTQLVWAGRPQRVGDRASDGLVGRDARSSPAIDAWQAPILDEPATRPDWFKAALFNELYYLVDGGTVWIDGRADPGGTTTHQPGTGTGSVGTGADGIGRFAILECFDYPFYNTVDVNFYASWALLHAVAPTRTPACSRISSPTIAHRRSRGRVPRGQRRDAPSARSPVRHPHDLGGPGGDPFLRPNHYRLPGQQHLEGPQQQVRPPRLAGRGRAR